MRLASWKLAPLLFTALLVGNVAGGAILEDIVRQEYELSSNASVSIRNTDGRIFIYGSDAPRLQITALRRAFSKERLEAIKVSVSITGETAVIETVYPPVASGSILADRSGTVDYVIMVPQTCTLENVELANGEMLIEGMRGAHVQARLERGLLHVSNCFTWTRLQLGQGKLNLRYAWWEEEEPMTVLVQVNDGDVRLALPEGAALRLDASSADGRVINRRTLPSTEGEAGAAGQTLKMEQGTNARTQFTLSVISGDIRIEKAY